MTQNDGDDPPIVAVILVAAGSGERLAAGIPKALVTVAGRTLLEHALVPIVEHPQIRDIIVVAPSTHLREYAALAPDATVVAGGAARQDSVAAGLSALAPEVEFVLVHDVARPFLPPAVIDRVLAALRNGASAVIPARPVTDTIKQVEGETVVATIDRAALRAVQTPQGFERHALEVAHASSAAALTDDAALIEAAGGRVVVVDGADEAFKITHPWDLRVAEALTHPRGQNTQ